MARRNTVEETFNFKKFNLKTLLLILITALLGGGGGVAAWQFASTEYVDKTVTEAQSLDEIRHQVLDERLGEMEVKIDEIATTTSQIKNAQNLQIARHEARALTAEMTNREEREASYDRLLNLNMVRLQNSIVPCATLSCTN